MEALFNISLLHYLVLAGIIFGLGFLGVLRRKNIVLLMLSTELMLNAANIALVAAGAYLGNYDGQIIALFILAIAASEVAVGLGLVVAWYRKYGSLDIDTIASMRG